MRQRVTERARESAKIKLYSSLFTHSLFATLFLPVLYREIPMYIYKSVIFFFFLHILFCFRVSWCSQRCLLSPLFALHYSLSGLLTVKLHLQLLLCTLALDLISVEWALNFIFRIDGLFALCYYFPLWIYNRHCYVRLDFKT